MRRFSLDEISDTSAFVVVDLDDAKLATGIIRAAKKVLVDGAKLLARSETYSWALMGEKNCGASGGINGPLEHAQSAYDALGSELMNDPIGETLHLRPGKGLAMDSDDPDHALLTSGVVAATRAALGTLEGHSVAVESGASVTAAIVSAFENAGATTTQVKAADLGADDSEVLICGSRTGVIDHDLATSMKHRVVVPMGPAPLTARAFAIMSKKGSVVVPDFLSIAGPLFAYRQPATESTELDVTTITGQIDDFVSTTFAELKDSDDGPFMAGCRAAEAFLGTWQDELPFGRPLA